MSISYEELKEFANALKRRVNRISELEWEKARVDIENSRLCQFITEKELWEDLEIWDRSHK